MGKRSNMERVKRDFYPTPLEAFMPIYHHLSYMEVYDEPCAGDGKLVENMISKGFIVGKKSDIEPKAEGIEKIDAMDLTEHDCDAFVTNPPYTWSILNPLITHLSALAPCWMLLPADMMHNKRMAPHMARCEKIVSIGRVKWFGGGGMENSAWYLFDANFTGQTEFFARDQSL